MHTSSGSPGVIDRETIDQRRGADGTRSRGLRRGGVAAALGCALAIGCASSSDVSSLRAELAETRQIAEEAQRTAAAAQQEAQAASAAAEQSAQRAEEASAKADRIFQTSLRK